MNVRGELIDLINRLIAVPETEDEEIRIANRISYLSPDENWSDYLFYSEECVLPGGRVDVECVVDKILGARPEKQYGEQPSDAKDQP